MRFAKLAKRRLAELVKQVKTVKLAEMVKLEKTHKLIELDNLVKTVKLAEMLKKLWCCVGGGSKVL